MVSLTNHSRFIPLLAVTLLVSTVGWGAVTVRPSPLGDTSGANAEDVTTDISDSATRITAPAGSEDGLENGREFVVAPLPSRNPALGWTVGLPAMWMYRPKSVSEENAAWITGVAGFYAENKSWGAGAFHRIGLDDDQWLAKVAAFYGDVRFDYYGIGESGNPGVFVPLRQKMQIYLAEALYALTPNLYVGLAAKVSNNQISIDRSSALPPDNLPDLSRDFSPNSLAPRIKYDSRDVEFYPTRGWLIDGTAFYGRDAFGSTSEYELFELNMNTFHKVGDHGVVAARLAFEYAGGDTPFFLYPAFGSGADLRGYQTGVYRDRNLIAGQVEYRHRFNRRLGAVVFAGVGSVSPDLFGWSKSLPSAGLGLRWVIAPENNLSLRVDYAWGDGDQQFYVGLGEAF